MPTSSPPDLLRASDKPPLDHPSSPIHHAPSPRPHSGSSPAQDSSGRLEESGSFVHPQGESSNSDDFSFEDWDDEDPLEGDDMPSDLRPPYHRPTDGRSETPLLGAKAENGYATGRPPITKKRSTFRERAPDEEAKSATRKRYTYATFFLAISLVSFTIQTETAVYIKKHLHWSKSYAMLYFTHGSWSMLWFLQLGIIRIQKWNMPWQTFWRRHVQILYQTALMVQHQDTLAPARYSHQSPVPYILKSTAFITTSLTVAGAAWYVAVSMTTASDLTAIYNCSAFFAYAFSIPLLKERLRWGKLGAVGVAIVGVLIVAYWDTEPAKTGNKSGGGTGGTTGDNSEHNNDTDQRALGNLVIGVGSVLYGFYEVLYKKYACPPSETSPGRSMIFANFFGTCIGLFTLLVLWIPLPILHVMGWERFEMPQGRAAWMLLISVLANAVFSGSFLVLISLTSPVLSSVAALLTIFLVALVDQLLPPPLHSPLTKAAMVGGILIIGAFAVLSWSTYKEMDEERREKAEMAEVDSDPELDEA